MCVCVCVCVRAPVCMCVDMCMFVLHERSCMFPSVACIYSCGAYHRSSVYICRYTQSIGTLVSTCGGLHSKSQWKSVKKGKTLKILFLWKMWS